MKKILALLVVLSMMLALASCGSDKTEPAATEQPAAENKTETVETAEADTLTAEGADVIVGAYTAAEDKTVTEEMKALFDKAFAETADAVYEPLFCLDTQVVAGTNYRFLCRKTVTAPEKAETLAIVTVYADLQGNASVTEILNADVDASAFETAGLDGGVTVPADYALTDSAKAALEKVMKANEGPVYEAVALLGTQVVAGTNYMLLCKVTSSDPSADASYAYAKIYEDLEGNCSMTESAVFTAAE